MEYKFKYEEKEYTLDESNFLEFVNDEEMPVEGFDLEKTLELLNGSDLSFDKAYYSSPCESCEENFTEKKSISEYLEVFFYIYTKNNKFVISNISKEYEGLTFNRLELLGEVDDSYITSVIVCKNCGKFIIQVEEVVI